MALREMAMRAMSSRLEGATIPSTVNVRTMTKSLLRADTVASKSSLLRNRECCLRSNYLKAE